MKALGVRYFVAATAAIALIAYVWIFTRPADPPIHSDGYSYYVYLPSWVIYRDISFESLARDWYGGIYPDFTGLKRWPTTGRWLNPHPLGTAVLMAPFFAAADMLSQWSNLPRDGFSLYYQHAAGLAGIAYLVAGLAVLRRILVRHFSDGVVLATLVCMTWGTNLFHYGVFDGTFSHVYSFFLVCLWILIVERWWNAPDWLSSIALGVVAALMVLVRHTNAVFMVVPLLYGVSRLEDLPQRLDALWRRRRSIAIAGVAAAVVMAPQIALYKATTGAWLASPYGALGVGFNWGTPHVFGVLFSTQKGLFFWSPLLLFSVWGALVARGWARGVVVAATVAFVLQTYLTAAWWEWQFGASYGHRAFTDGFGLAALTMAAFFEWSARRPAVRRVVAGIAALCVALSVVQMLQYWTGSLPTANTSWQVYRESFLWFR